mmetsp:Transcript_25540/g.64044  ORF Transcript_25540/g.64044 Transcript_25540/m.64044 type:complete len:168 (+) Transcript_25540:1657-2160(+)
MSGKPNQMWKRGSQNERNHLPWLTLSDGGDETIHRKTKPHELFFSFLFPPKHARPRLLTFVVLLFFLTFLPGSPHLDCFSFLLLRSREDGSFVNDTYENNEPHHWRRGRAGVQKEKRGRRKRKKKKKRKRTGKIGLELFKYETILSHVGLFGFCRTSFFFFFFFPFR